MMKKALFMLAMLTCIFASCSDGGSDEPSNPTPKPEEVKSEITLDNGIVTNGLSFGVAQGEQSVSFTTNTNWTLSIAATTGGSTWCKASATSGSKGTSNVKFTVTENTDYDDRSVSVTIKAGTASKTFTITQKGADALLVTTKKYEVAQAGGKIEVEVKANIEYQLAVSETAKDWIKETQSKSRALTTKKHTFEIAENEEVEKREGEITIKSGDKVETVKVYQTGGAVLLLSKNEYNISDKGDTISVDIKSNFEFGIQMPDVDWITNDSKSRGFSSHTLFYIIHPNTTYDERESEIVFYDKNSELKERVIIKQDKFIKVINVEKTGTLSQTITENEKFNIKSLRLSGELNGTDIKFLREMAGLSLFNEETDGKLEDLDMTDAIITDGGEAYYCQQYDNQNYYTKNNEIGHRMFSSSTLKKIKLPKNTKIIHSEAFRNAPLKSITIPNEVIEIGSGAFYNTNIDSIAIPNNITILEDNVFYGCTGLRYVNLPNDLKVIKNSTFEGCNGLTEILLPENLKSIGEAAFGGCEGLEQLNFPNNLEYIGARAFANCDRLSIITIPDRIKSIEHYTFGDCNNLKSINLPKNLENIGSYAFSSCWSLSSLAIPESVVSIGSYAFQCCGDLETISIPSGLTEIHAHTFDRCSDLKNINIPIGIKKIYSNTFEQCFHLGTIVIPDNVQEIDPMAFWSCNIDSLVISEKITKINTKAFQTTDARIVSLPSTLKLIEASAFKASTIDKIYLKSKTPPIVYNNNFEKEILKNCKVYIPKDYIETYRSADIWKDFDNLIEY